MVLSHQFWTRIFRHEFGPQLSAIVEALEKRMLPAFTGIEEEAEAASKEAWDAFMSAPGTGDEDPAAFAEEAEQAGVSHYMLMDGIRQGMVNLFAAALYHAFEQQAMLFLRKQILGLGDENNPKLFQMGEFQKRLKALGIDITSFSSWSKVDELRLVANTVKHAEGDSGQKLHPLRPDLFKHPKSSVHILSFGKGMPRVFLPLVGEGLYASPTDVQQYRDSLIEFWKELGDAMERA
jgi:hypothetical protein